MTTSDRAQQISDLFDQLSSLMTEEEKEIYPVLPHLADLHDDLLLED
jgi:hypothetical protein